jgi:hypothetical protein
MIGGLQEDQLRNHVSIMVALVVKNSFEVFSMYKSSAFFRPGQVAAQGFDKEVL